MIDNEDVVLVSDVLEFIRNYVINVGQLFMFEGDLSLPLYVCFRTTHAVFRYRRVEQKLTVKLGIPFFRTWYRRLSTYFSLITNNVNM